jgi:hypothetical protein
MARDGARLSAKSSCADSLPGPIALIPDPSAPPLLALTHHTEGLVAHGQQSLHGRAPALKVLEGLRARALPREALRVGPLAVVLVERDDVERLAVRDGEREEMPVRPELRSAPFSRAPTCMNALLPRSSPSAALAFSIGISPRYAYLCV